MLKFARVTSSSNDVICPNKVTYLLLVLYRVLCHPLGDFGVPYTVRLWLVGKRVVDFVLVLIELFSPALTVEAL